MTDICIQISDTHESMTIEGQCPRCEERELYRDSVDVGVGVIHGPWGCPMCGWSEDTEYDLAHGGGIQDDGSYLDPYGGKLPSANPIAMMLSREAQRFPEDDWTEEQHTAAIAFLALGGAANAA